MNARISWSETGDRFDAIQWDDVPCSGNSDPYGVLGLDHDAGQTDIKAAYRSLMKKYHPDSRPSNQRRLSTEVSQRLNDAYETLKDPQRKAEYDEQMRRTTDEKQ